MMEGPRLKARFYSSLLCFALLCSAGVVPAAAAGKKTTLDGVLVDVACATERSNDLSTLGIKHTKKCLQMPDCDKSGFALLTKDNKVLQFDEAGNGLARKLIAQTDREKDWRVKVSGKLDGDKVAVRKLAIAK
jgi:hypothetical protein